MPLKLIKPWPKQPAECTDADHKAVWIAGSLEPGTWEHKCPSCGVRTTFMVQPDGRVIPKGAKRHE